MSRSLQRAGGSIQKDARPVEVGTRIVICGFLLPFRLLADVRAVLVSNQASSDDRLVGYPGPLLRQILGNLLGNLIRRLALIGFHHTSDTNIYL